MSALARRSPRQRCHCGRTCRCCLSVAHESSKPLQASDLRCPPIPPRDASLSRAWPCHLAYPRSGAPDMNAAFTKALELAEIVDDTRYRLGAIFGLYAHRLTTASIESPSVSPRSSTPWQPRRRIVPMCRSATGSSAKRCTSWETSLERDDTSSRWFARAPPRFGRRTSSSINTTSECCSIATTGASSGCRD